MSIIPPFVPAVQKFILGFRHRKGTFSAPGGGNSVPPLAPQRLAIGQVSGTGIRFSFAVDEGGGLWTWGQNDSGQLLGGKVLDGKVDAEALSPIQVGEGYKDVLFGDTCAAIKEDNSLWVWGQVDTGCVAGDLQAGDRRYGRDRYQTEPLKIMDDVEQFAMWDYALALRGDGSFWCWGGSNSLRDIFDPATGETGEYLDSPQESWQTPVELPKALLDLTAGGEEEQPEAEPLEPVSAGVDPRERGMYLEPGKPYSAEDQAKRARLPAGPFPVPCYTSRRRLPQKTTQASARTSMASM